jgi:AraC-like DNA-binding protein
MQNTTNTDFNVEDSLGCLLETVPMKIISAQTLDFTTPWDFYISDEMASFYMVINGRCRLKMDGTENSIDMGCGDLAVLLNNKAHRLQNDSQCCRRLLHENRVKNPEKIAAPRTAIIRGVFTWEGTNFASFLPEMPPAILIKCKEGRLLPWMSRTIMLIADESASDRPGVRAIINHLSNVIFIQGMRAHLAATSGNGGQALETKDQKQLSPALFLMNAQPEESWSLSSLARKCAMSRSAFAESFKQAVGQTPMNYLLKVRMNKACDLLSQNILGIKKISEQAGYRSQSSFSNAFKRWSGSSPGSYRKSQRSR